MVERSFRLIVKGISGQDNILEALKRVLWSSAAKFENKDSSWHEHNYNLKEVKRVFCKEACIAVVKCF